jgi:phage-related holin
MSKMLNTCTNPDPVSVLIDFFLKIVVVILATFSEARTILHSILFLILIDQVMGVTLALKMNQFSWKTFNKVYRKVITYMCVVLATFAYERYILNSEGIYFTRIMAGIVGFQELSSAYLTFTKMTGFKIIEKFIDKIKD